MRTFRVYKHPIQGFQAVKVGWSWPAFFFPAFWMFVKRLWGLTILFVLAYGVFSYIEADAEKMEESVAQGLIYLSLVLAYFALSLIALFKGNKWRERNLSKRGYELLNTVQAETPDAAIAKSESGKLA